MSEVMLNPEIIQTINWLWDAFVFSAKFIPLCAIALWSEIDLWK